jgi:hypothetical protein
MSDSISDRTDHCTKLSQKPSLCRAGGVTGAQLLARRLPSKLSATNPPSNQPTSKNTGRRPPPSSSVCPSPSSRRAATGTLRMREAAPYILRSHEPLRLPGPMRRPERPPPVKPRCPLSRQKSVLGLEGVSPVSPPSIKPRGTPRVVAQGVDTLELNGHPELATRFLAELKRGKEIAQQERGGNYPIQVAGRTFLLQPSGTAGYPWKLVHGDMVLFVCPYGSSETPGARIKFLSSFLWEVGAFGAVAEAEKIFKEIDRKCVLRKMTVSRLDVCVDVVGVTFGLDDYDKFICRARHCGSWGIPATGFQFGKGKITGRIYNKEIEIKKSKKLWFRDIWGTEEDEAGQYPDVWRTEFQWRREFIKAGIYRDAEGKVIEEPSVGEVLGSISATWEYCVHDWLSLRVENENDRQASRWEFDERWKVLQGLDWGDLSGHSFIRSKARKAKEDQMIKQIAGCVISIAELREEVDIEAVMADVAQKVLIEIKTHKKSLYDRLLAKGFDYDTLMAKINEELADGFKQPDDEMQE